MSTHNNKLVVLLLATLSSVFTSATAFQVFYTCTNASQVALCLDDGPWIWQSDITQTLQENNAVATFFVNGHNWGCIYEDSLAQNLKNTYNMGNQIASHTWSHADLTTLDANGISDEMLRLETALIRLLGVAPAVMRPPYGARDDFVLSELANYVQGAILWNLDSRDSAGASVAESQQIYNSVESQNPPNGILTLNHETYYSTVSELLPWAIQSLRSAGYDFVTVADCTGLPAYKDSANPGDYCWSCDC